MHGLFLHEVATQRARDLQERGAEMRRAREAGSRRTGGPTVRRLRHIGLLLSRR